MFLRDNLPGIVQILQNGGMICYPTDTIWGLGCDATNETAIEKIGEIKGGQPEKGYIILVSSIQMLKKYVAWVPPRLETLLAYHMRPLTVIFEEPENLPKSVLSPEGTAAIRLVHDPFCQQLIDLFGKPLVSTAAADWGKPFPASFGAITSDILQACDYVVRHRQQETEPGRPSSIARLDEFEEIQFVRE